MRTTLPIKNIEPQHPVRYPRRARALAESIRQRGWVGRPIVVADFGRGLALSGARYLALNGTHRLEALRLLDERRAPVEVLDVSRWPYEDARALDDAEDVRDRAAVLRRRGKGKLARWVEEEGWEEYDRPGRARRKR